MCKRPAHEVVAGNVRIVTNGVDLASNKKALEYAKIFPNVYPANGLYPTHGIESSEKELAEVFQFIEKNKDKIVAVGEVGIDFYHITKPKQQKKEIEVFKQIIELANKINKPLVVHSRKAAEEALSCLRAAKVPVIMHCFEGNATQTHDAIERGYYFTIPANFATRKGFKKTAQRVPITQLMTETDSPYLSPIDGENKPANVSYALDKLAELKKMTRQQVETHIYQNFKQIFIK